MHRRAHLSLLLWIMLGACSGISLADSLPADDLKVVIIRHAEKPDTGHNLSCQGQNRALLLPKVLHQKFNYPGEIYVASTGVGRSNAHFRMLETIIPFAVKYELRIDAEFELSAYPALVDQVLKKHGTILIVWEHTGIPALATQLGVISPPRWKGKDFDSIWVISYAGGKASLFIDREGIEPPIQCAY